MQTGGHVYIIANHNHKKLYVGVTSDLYGRIVKHKTKFYPNSYSAQWNINKLVYFEELPTIMDAIRREKQIKKYSHLKKVLLIIAQNPTWEDLHESARYL